MTFLHVSNDEIIPASEMDYEDNQKLVIFDDFFCERNQRKLVDYFIQGRHKNCSISASRFTKLQRISD